MTRKEFLSYFTGMAAISLAAVPFLSSCKSKQKTEKSQTKAGADSDPCNDRSGLSESEIKARESYQYVGKSPYPEKKCSNCEFWGEPEGESPCGICGLFEGPVNPEGHCTGWVAMEE